MLYVVLTMLTLNKAYLLLLLTDLKMAGCLQMALWEKNI